MPEWKHNFTHKKSSLRHEIPHKYYWTNIWNYLFVQAFGAFGNNGSIFSLISLRGVFTQLDYALIVMFPKVSMLKKQFHNLTKFIDSAHNKNSLNLSLNASATQTLKRYKTIKRHEIWRRKYSPISHFIICKHWKRGKNIINDIKYLPWAYIFPCCSCFCSKTSLQISLLNGAVTSICDGTKFMHVMLGSLYLTYYKLFTLWLNPRHVCYFLGRGHVHQLWHNMLFVVFW